MCDFAYRLLCYFKDIRGYLVTGRLTKKLFLGFDLFSISPTLGLTKHPRLSTCHSELISESRKCAFTLAEVLITLGIIGVVAAMTMPTLIANHQKQQTVVQLKKAYSEISQALKLAEPEHGLMETWNLSDFETSEERAAYFADNYLLKNLKVIKDCRPANYECWTSVTNIDGDKTATVFANISGSNVGHNAFITASGYSAYYWLHGTGEGGWLTIDINGTKKPNKLGKDVFIFMMTWANDNSYKQGIYPIGLHKKDINPTKENLINGGFDTTHAQYSFNCLKNSGTNYAGGYCGALMLQNGWQITPDYPW